MGKTEFWTLIVTMIVGGLAYSIVSFSYMHSTFTTRNELELNSSRMDRYENRIDRKLTEINTKLDRIIENRR